MYDVYGNVVPYAHRTDYEDLFTFKFGFDSQFTTNFNCEIFSAADYTVICKIRALNAGA